jgi:hypothetical protein
MELAEKQYIAYEMIACTFLLGLLKDGNDSNTTLFTSTQKTMGGESPKEITDIMKTLKARGSQEQLILFLTGPAGSGKSTAMRVAEHIVMNFVQMLVSCEVIQHSCLQHTQDQLHH